MKLLKKIATNNFVLKIRNTINFKRVPVFLNDENNNQSISDAFPWRTDNGFKTKFKFTDILKLLFSEEGSELEIKFFDHKYNEIKSIILKNFNLTDSLIITKDFLSYEGYGVFFVFHRKDKNLNISSSINNRCYIGFSISNDIYSYAHGNTFVLGKSINSKIDKTKKNFVHKSFLVNQKYFIQNNFLDSEKIELFFANPLSKKINIAINKNCSFALNPYNSKIISIFENTHLIKIRSDCTFLRPYVFNYRGSFIDFHHS